VSDAIHCELCCIGTISGIGKTIIVGPSEHAHKVYICDDCETLIKHGTEVVISHGTIVGETIHSSSQPER